MSKKRSENANQRAERLLREGMKSDGQWNRRVVRHPCGSLCIHEVHYREGRVSGWSQTYSEAADAEDGLAGLQEWVEATYEQSLDALGLPILEWSDLPHRSN